MVQKENIRVLTLAISHGFLPVAGSPNHIGDRRGRTANPQAGAVDIAQTDKTDDAKDNSRQAEAD